jgi:hypothetical protein
MGGLLTQLSGGKRTGFGNLAFQPFCKFWDYYSQIPSTVIMLIIQVQKESRYNTSPQHRAPSSGRQALIFGEQANFRVDHYS